MFHKIYMHWVFFFLLSIGCHAEEKIFFLHIPKSGGLTLRAILTDHYPVGTYKCGSKLDGNFDSLADYSLVCEHFRYFDVKESLGHFFKMTFLRDPISRVISEHHYILDRTHVEKGTAGVLKEHFLPLEGDPIETAENIVCKCLSRLNPLDPSISIEKHLESAKESLAHDFDFIGITERMEESIALFHNFVGWEPPEWTPTHNTTPRNKSYSREILDAIARRNWADIALYKYAIELFEKQKTNIVSRSFTKQVEWVDRVDFDFRAPLDGWGWCPRENWPEGVFRWLCTPEQGLITFPLQSGKNYSFEAQLHIPSHLLSHFRLLINGTPIRYVTKKIKQYADRKNWFLVQTTIPSEYIKEGKKTQITFMIEDLKRKPIADSYRGRCGSNRIRILPKSSNS